VTARSGSEEPRYVPVRSIYDLIWAIGIGSGSSEGRIPLQPSKLLKSTLGSLDLNPPLSAFRPRGVSGPTSELSSRAPAQMGRREMEHEGGRNRQRGNPRPLCCPAPRSGALAVGGYKRPRGRERALCAGPFPRAANLLI
jgi:hypothetical protein